ncbi:sigma-70 family RNA polymerase sigma factor [Engelhardtia mirabilis]|uniref:sigma-70 family RNA polymerase sigma factor n=1 Tax=Engelhardtia mirabilis TaxID=2528011 RepID=UPI003AF3A0AF
MTAILAAVAREDAGAADALFPHVYEELRALAGALFRGSGSEHTLQPTAVVHEVYLKLVGDAGDWNGREHFFALAATAMRQVLIDHARRKRADKRGGRWDRVSLDDSAPSSDLAPSVVELDDALAELERENPRPARVIELRYFGGLSVVEAARVLGVSERTVKSEWRFARAWLRAQLTPDA